MALLQEVGQAGEIVRAEEHAPIPSRRRARSGRRRCRARTSSSLMAASRFLPSASSFAPDLTKPFQLFSSSRSVSGSRPSVGAALVEIVDAREQLLVHRDRRIVPRHLRRDLALHRLDLVVGVGAGLAPEDRRDAVERVARQFQRDEACCRSSASRDCRRSRRSRPDGRRARHRRPGRSRHRQSAGNPAGRADRPNGSADHGRDRRQAWSCGISGKRGERIPM